jgi:hypothetical protein
MLEKLIKGFDIPSLAVVPHLHTEDLPEERDTRWCPVPLSQIVLKNKNLQT